MCIRDRPPPPPPPPPPLGAGLLVRLVGGESVELLALFHLAKLLDFTKLFELSLAREHNRRGA
eukprot:4959720-Prymnesium_polylepis.1